jgi:hypothetical protein
MRADILADGDRGAGRHRGGLGLARAGQRQRAERGQAAGDEAGAAKECTAIKTAVRLVGKRGGKLTVACLAFCSFDQHSSLPYFVGYRFTR